MPLTHFFDNDSIRHAAIQFLRKKGGSTLEFQYDSPGQTSWYAEQYREAVVEGFPGPFAMAEAYHARTKVSVSPSVLDYFSSFAVELHAVWTRPVQEGVRAGLLKPPFEGAVGVALRSGLVGTAFQSTPHSDVGQFLFLPDGFRLESDETGYLRRLTALEWGAIVHTMPLAKHMVAAAVRHVQAAQGRATYLQTKRLQEIALARAEHSLRRVALSPTEAMSFLAEVGLAGVDVATLAVAARLVLIQPSDEDSQQFREEGGLSPLTIY